MWKKRGVNFVNFHTEHFIDKQYSDVIMKSEDNLHLIPIVKGG